MYFLKVFKSLSKIKTKDSRVIRESKNPQRTFQSFFFGVVYLHYHDRHNKQYIDQNKACN